MKATISGIRGIIGKDMGLREVVRFCGAFAGIVGGTCVLGRDTRPSGGALYDAAGAALTGGGMDVSDMGVVPTPAVFREARRRGAGVVVTSSHNPITWNGLKFVVDGRGADAAMMRHITETRAGGAVRCGSRQAIPSAYEKEAVQAIGTIDGEVAVLVDAGGGAATHAAPKLLRMLGCRTGLMQNDIPRPDPTAGGLDTLARRSTDYDIGVAFDMDGDRMVLAVGGAIQPPDATLGLGVAAAMKRGHRDFVFSFDTSILVERYVLRRGGSVSRSAVGEANVVSSMMQNGAGAGGEGSSAGFILGEFNWCRDGMLAAGLIASMVPDGTLEPTLQEVTGTAIVREKVRGDASMLPRLEGRIRGISSETDTTDGIRGIIDEDAWVLVRPSNTEDVLRISAEGRDAERCGMVVSRIREWISDAVRG